MAKRSSRTFGPRVTLGDHEATKPEPVAAPSTEIAPVAPEEVDASEVVPKVFGTGRSIADYIPNDISVSVTQKDGLMKMSFPPGWIPASARPGG